MGKSIEKRREEILSLVNKYGTLDFAQLRKALPADHPGAHLAQEIECRIQILLLLSSYRLCHHLI